MPGTRVGTRATVPARTVTRPRLAFPVRARIRQAGLMFLLVQRQANPADPHPQYGGLQIRGSLAALHAAPSLQLDDLIGGVDVLQQ